MSADPRPGFAQRVRAGEVVLGSFVLELPVRATPEALAAAGFDFAVLDLEHAATDLERLSFLVATCRSAGLAPLVRIPAGALHVLTAVLDMEPDGILAPGVASAAEARAVAAVSRYHPAGRRGLAPLVRHPARGTLAERDAATLVIVQIEGREALAEADAIAATPGVDVVFIGPYDLSQALGVPGEVDHPDVGAAVAEIAVAAVGRARLGIYAGSAERAAALRALGITLFAHGTDGRLLLDAATRAAAGWSAVKDSGNRERTRPGRSR